MANLDQQVRESQTQVEEAQAKIAELTSRIETARSKIKGGEDATLDIENASLEDIHAHTEVMNANIAELIMGLDDVTAGFSKDFDEMRTKSGWESVVGMFSKHKADSMRQERIKTANIDDKLQDLISKSDVITQLLEGQLAILEEQKVKVEANLGETLDERELTVGELETLRTDISAMDPDIIALERDGAARAGQTGQIANAGALYRKGQNLGGFAAEPGRHADGADQQVADRYQTACCALRCPDQIAENRAAAGCGPPHQRNRRANRPRGAIRHGRNRDRNQQTHGRNDGSARGSHGLRPRGA